MTIKQYSLNFKYGSYGYYLYTIAAGNILNFSIIELIYKYDFKYHKKRINIFKHILSKLR